MYNDKRILAIIPARGGSKGILNKNLKIVNNKPLIQYTIDEALKSKYIDKIVVSTDSEEIGRVAKRLGASFPFKRPKELAEDTSKTIDAIVYTIDKLKEEKLLYDYVLTLQPTQPLRKAFHIDEAIEKVIDAGEDSLISISEVDDHPVLMKTINASGYLENLLGGRADARRQDFSKIYKVDGLIYINKIDDNLNNKTSLNDNKLPYIIDKKYNLDIDEPMDLLILESILKEGAMFGI